MEGIEKHIAFGCGLNAIQYSLHSRCDGLEEIKRLVRPEQPTDVGLVSRIHLLYPILVEGQCDVFILPFGSERPFRRDIARRHEDTVERVHPDRFRACADNLLVLMLVDIEHHGNPFRVFHRATHHCHRFIRHETDVGQCEP